MNLSSIIKLKLKKNFSASDPYLYLRVETKPFEEIGEVEEETMTIVEAKPQGLPGIMNLMNHVSRAEDEGYALQG